MFKKLFSSALVLSVGLASALGQTCENPASLCGGDAQELSTFEAIDFTGLGLDSCFTGDTYTVARFHTSFLETSDGADVNISGVACPGPMQALVVQASPLDYCDTDSYSAVSDCISFNGDISFTTDDLYINTDYLILIVGTAGTDPFDCALTVEVSGTPFTISACCPTNIAFLESAELEVVGGDVAAGYSWTPSQFVDDPTSHSVTVTPDFTTVFEVVGFVENCQYSDNVLVVVGTEIDVPNAFSPNDDLINDTWDITGLSSYIRSRLTLYDRWGQIVLRSIAYTTPWDGKFNGQDVPAGTYYYVIELNEPGVDLEPITGNVAVIR